MGYGPFLGLSSDAPSRLDLRCSQDCHRGLTPPTQGILSGSSRYWLVPVTAPVNSDCLVNILSVGSCTVKFYPLCN